MSARKDGQKKRSPLLTCGHFQPRGISPKLLQVKMPEGKVQIPHYYCRGCDGWFYPSGKLATEPEKPMPARKSRAVPVVQTAEQQRRYNAALKRIKTWSA